MGGDDSSHPGQLPSGVGSLAQTLGLVKDGAGAKAGKASYSGKVMWQSPPRPNSPIFVALVTGLQELVVDEASLPTSR